MDEETDRSAGWYPHAEMPGTQRYWNGSEWTEHVAPLAQKPAESTGPGALTIARGVALGLVAVVILLAIIGNMASSGDAMDCELDNVDRALAGQAVNTCD